MNKRKRIYSLDKAFEYFKNWMKTQDFHISTKKDYTSINLKFKEFASKDVEYINEVTHLLLNNFFDNQRSEGMSECTIYKYFMALKTFFNLMYSMEIIECNPTARILLEKPKDSKEYYYINYDEIEEIINTIKIVENPLRRLTDICYTRTLAETGARRSDCLNLNWNTINFKERTIKIYVKKINKDIIVPMREILYADLINLAKLVRINTDFNPFNPIFLSNNNTRLPTSTVNTYFKKYVENSGVIKRRIDIINMQELSDNQKQEEIKKVKMFMKFQISLVIQI